MNETAPKPRHAQAEYSDKALVARNGSTQDPAPPVYLQTEQLAVHTDTSGAYWRKLRSEKRGPPFSKIGNLVLYEWSQVKAWLDQHRQSTAA